jgi:phospholipid-transporting ATPase
MNKLAPPLDPPEELSVGHSDLSPPYLHASTFSAGSTVYHHKTGSTQREPSSSIDRSSSKLQSDASMPAEVSSMQRPPSSQELPVSNDVPANNKKEKQVDDIFLPAAAAGGITTMAPPPLGDEWRGTSASLSRRSMGSSSSSRIPRHVTDETAFGSSRRGSRRVSDTRRLSQREDFPDSRFIYINNPDRTNENYTMAGNKVRTSKYTLISFVPRNLFEQFHRYAYIYFLLLVILNQIPQLAVFGRFASLVPLILVLVITAIKDGFEDWGRHRSDSRENNRVALVLSHDGQYTYKKWKHIRVGEMVKVHANETVPCDMVLLGTSDPSGVAYVETLNLDGESNLKSRYARQETSNQHPEVGPLTGLIVCKAPDRNIYDFSAFMELPADSHDIRIPLGQNNIILRGCEVKNTSWVVGVVVYAGRETKAMLNSSGAQSKRSKLEHYMNRETGWLVVFLALICFVGGLGMGLWVAANYDYLDIIMYYKKMDSNGGNYLFSGSVGEGIYGFLSCVIRFQVMIPLSLYISMELVRLGQSYFMIRDTEMYDAGSNSKFQCRALNINEDLGQIKYLFSDKTGTLTENKMEFHTASIDGVDYSNTKVVIEPATGKIEGSITPEDSRFVEEILTKQAWKPKVGAKVDPDLVHLLTGRLSTAPRRDALFDYMLVLVACNTIVPTRVKKTASGQLEMEAVNSMEDGSGFIEYQGESPDEQALVAAAAAYGFTLLERTSANIVVNVLGEVQRYEVLGIHEFDSVRKCMSVVVGCPDGTIKLLVKGADSTVLSLIGPGDDENTAERRESAEQLQWQAEVREQTLKHLDKYAREGLRTLVIASRVLTQKEVEDWHFHYAKASTALHDRVGMLRNAAGLVENNLVLLGASGIEDRLQVSFSLSLSWEVRDHICFILTYISASEG